jgi:hypothetical protein
MIKQPFNKLKGYILTNQVFLKWEFTYLTRITAVSKTANVPDFPLGNLAIVKILLAVLRTWRSRSIKSYIPFGLRRALAARVKINRQ